MKKVLITGATGFIGRHCLPLLLERGYEIHATCSRKTQGAHLNVNWHTIDLLNPVSVTELLNSVRPTHLLHFAWYVKPGKCWNAIENFHWVQASLELLRAFTQCAGKRAVWAGSCAEYDWEYGFLSEKKTPLSPISFYGSCKHSLQSLVTAFSENTGLTSAWGRIFYLFGPYEHPKRLVPSVIRSLLLNEQAHCSHGRQIRDYLYVKDVADAFVSLLESSVQGPVNIASGRPVSLRDMVYRIADQLSGRDLIQLGAISTPEAEPNLLVADVRRLSDEVGWFPKFTLDNGLEETIAWWRRELRMA